MLYFDELRPKFNDNSSITRSEFNALVQAVQRISNPQGGFGFQSGEAANIQFDKSIEVPSWFPIKSTPAIPIYSVFTLKTQTPAPTNNTYYPVMVEVEKITNSSSRLLLLTNGPNTINSNTGGVARIIDWFTPIILRTHTDTTTNPLPIPGETCGPIPDSFLVAANGHGLICLAISEDEKYVQCVAAQPGQRFLVKPVNTIAKNGQVGDVILWRGPKGAEVETDPQVKFTGVCNRTSADSEADKFAEVVAIGPHLYVVPWECAAATDPPVSPATGTGGMLDDFNRAIDNDINVGFIYPYTPVLGGDITDYMIVSRSGADHACRISAENTGVVQTTPSTTTSSTEVVAEIEGYGLANNDEAGVLLSYLDDNTYYSVFAAKGASDFTVNIVQVTAGVPMVLATSVISPPPGSRHWVVGRIDFVSGKIEGWVRDENLIKSAIIQADYVPNLGYQVGFGCGSISGGGTNDVDNFKISETHLM